MMYFFGADGQRQWLASWPSCLVLLQPLDLSPTALAVPPTPPAKGRRRHGDDVIELGDGLKKTTLSAHMPVN